MILKSQICFYIFYSVIYFQNKQSFEFQGCGDTICKIQTVTIQIETTRQFKNRSISSPNPINQSLLANQSTNLILFWPNLLIIRSIGLPPTDRSAGLMYSTSFHANPIDRVPSSQSIGRPQVGHYRIFFFGLPIAHLPTID